MLLVNERGRRIDILTHLVVLHHEATREAHHFAANGQEGEHHAPAEAVIESAILTLAADTSAYVWRVLRIIEQVFLLKAFLLGNIPEGSFLGRVTYLELTDNILSQSALAQVAHRYGCAFGGVP